MSNNVIIAITIITIIIIIIIIILIVNLLHKADYSPAQQIGMKQGISWRARTQIGFQPSSIFKYRFIH